MELGHGGSGKRGWIAESQEMLDGWGEMLDHCDNVGDNTTNRFVWKSGFLFRTPSPKKVRTT
jgi:hypothetical protein